VKQFMAPSDPPIYKSMGGEFFFIVIFLFFFCGLFWLVFLFFCFFLFFFGGFFWWRYLVSPHLLDELCFCVGSTTRKTPPARSSRASTVCRPRRPVRLNFGHSLGLLRSGSILRTTSRFDWLFLFPFGHPARLC